MMPGSLLWWVSALSFVACDLGKSRSVDAKLVFRDPAVAALAEAAADGDTGRISELVRAGSDPNVRGDKGVNLLQWAVLNRSKRGLEASAKGFLVAIRSSGLEVSKALAAKAIARLP